MAVLVVKDDMINSVRKFSKCMLLGLGIFESMELNTNLF